ncbi:MAG: aminotransferase class V-fold PLP-dependent enzyme [Nitriliruptorales bacterium]|nr:aminotransferase class V-fold PLP-dependent enzyme [Nitriliruptorales bacterium]
MRVYLDHASAWPLRTDARRAHDDASAVAWADPSRRHTEGRQARDVFERATVTAAELLGAPDHGIVWTASGTESIHLAVLGTARSAIRRGDPRRHLVTCAVEHSAVLMALQRLRDEHGFDLTIVPVDASGTVDAAVMIDALRDDTLSVHLQHANHEVGALQPTHEVGSACRERGILLHVDACQTVGQLGVTLEQLGADLLSASAVKFGGPSGVGLLAAAPQVSIAPLLEGDDRQRRRRSGREDVPGVAAAAVALQAAVEAMPTERSARELVRRHLRQELPRAIEDLELHGPLADAHPGIVACSALYVDGEALVVALDEAGFAVHSGSSCATATGEPSHVLVAMGALTHGHVRVSVGPTTTIDDADRFIESMAAAVAELRAHSRRRMRGGTST